MSTNGWACKKEQPPAFNQSPSFCNQALPEFMEGDALYFPKITFKKTITYRDPNGNHSDPRDKKRAEQESSAPYQSLPVGENCRFRTYGDFATTHPFGASINMDSSWGASIYRFGSELWIKLKGADGRDDFAVVCKVPAPTLSEALPIISEWVDGISCGQVPGVPK